MTGICMTHEIIESEYKKHILKERIKKVFFFLLKKEFIML